MSLHLRTTGLDSNHRDAKQKDQKDLNPFEDPLQITVKLLDVNNVLECLCYTHPDTACIHHDEDYQ